MQTARLGLGLGTLARAVLLLAMASGVAQAANITWEGDTSADWHTGANWTGGVAPAAGDNCTIPFDAIGANDVPDLGTTDEPDAVNLLLELGASVNYNDASINVASVTILATGTGTGASITGNAAGGNGLNPLGATVTFALANGDLTVARVTHNNTTTFSLSGTNDLVVTLWGNSTQTLSVTGTAGAPTFTINNLSGDDIDGVLTVNAGVSVTIADPDVATIDADVGAITCAGGSLTINENLNLAGFALNMNGGNCTINGNLTITATNGQVDFSVGSASVLTVTGNVNLGTGGGVNAASSDMPSGEWHVQGDWDAGGDDELNATGGTIFFDGAAQAITAASGTLANLDFFNVTIAGSGTKTFDFTNAAGQFFCNGDCTINGGTLDLDTNNEVFRCVNLSITNGTLDLGAASTITGTTSIGDGSGSTGTAVLDNSAGGTITAQSDWSQNGDGSTTGDGNFIPHATNALSFTFNTDTDIGFSPSGDSYGAVTINTAATARLVTVTSSVGITTLTVTSGTLELNAPATVTVTTAIDVDGTLDVQGGTLDLDVAFTSGSTGTVTQSGGLVRASLAVDLSGLGGNYTATAGTLELDGAAQSLTVGGGSGVDTLFNVTCNGTADATVVAGAVSFRVDGTLTLATKGLTLGTSTGLLDLRATGTAVSIGSGTTLNLGTVSSADIAGSVVFGATGTWNANSRAVTLAGNFDASAGGTLSNPGAFTFDGALATQTITVSANADTFAGVTIAHGTGTDVVQLAGAAQTLTATSVSINRGNLTVGASTTLDVNGLITIGDGVAGAATLTNAAGGVLAGGGLTRNATDGDYAPGAGVLIFDGAGTWTSSADDDFGSVTVSAAVTIAAGSTVSVTLLDVTTSTLSVDATGTLEVEGTAAIPVTLTGALTGGTVIYRTNNGAGTVRIAATNATYTNLVVDNDGELFDANGALSVGGTLTVRGGVLAPGVANLLDVNGLITIGDGAGAAGSAVLLGNGGINAGGGLSRNATDGDYSTAGTLTFDGPGTWTGNGDSFGVVVVSAAVTAGSSDTVSSLNVTSGALAVGANTLTDTGDLIVAGNGFTASSGGVILSGTGTWSGASVVSFGAVTKSTGGTTTLGSAVTAAGLTVSAGTLALGGNTLTATTAFAMSGGTIDDSNNSTSVLDVDVAFAPSGGVLDLSDGTLRCANNVTLTGLTTVSFGTAGTLDMNGTAAGTHTITLKAAGDLRNLRVTRNAVGQLVALAGFNPVTIGGTTTLVEGTLSLDESVTFAGAVQVQAGAALTVAAQDQTYTFQAGLDVQTSGAANFTQDGTVCIFNEGTTFVAAGAVTVTGSAGSGNQVTLRDQDALGSSDGNKWTFNTSGGTISITRARVQDSTATPGATASSSVDEGGNTNWTFGGTKTTTWTRVGTAGVWSNNANWSDGAPTGTGDTVVFDAAGTADSSNDTAYTIAALTMTGYTGTLTVSNALSVSGAATTGGTVNVNTTSTWGALTVSGGTTTVATAVTLTVSGALTQTGALTVTGALSVGGAAEIDGTLTVNGSATLGNIGTTSTGSVAGTGNFTLPGTTYDFTGTNFDFAPTGGTTTFTATGASTLALNADDVFSTFARTAASGTLTVTGALVTGAAGGLTVSGGGNLTLANAANNIGTGGVTVSAGTLSIGGGTTQVAGDWNLTGAAGFTPNASTIDFDGGAAQSIVPAGRAFNSVTKSGAGTATVTGNLSIPGTLQITNGTFAFANATNALGTVDVNAGTFQGNGGTITVTGDWDFTGTGSFTINATTIQFTGTNAQTITPAGDAFGVLQINKSSNTASVTGALSCASLAVQAAGSLAAGSTVAVTAGDLAVSAGAYSATGATTITGNLTISAGSVTLGNASNSVTGNMTLSAGSLVGNATAGSLSVGGNWDTSGGSTTFTPNAMVVVFNGGGNQSITPADAFGVVLVNKAGGTATATGTLTTNGQLQVQAGALATAATTVSTGGLLVSGGAYTASGLTTVTAGGLSITSGSFSGAAVTVSAGGASVTGGTYAATGASSITGDVSVSGGAGVTATLGNAANSVSGNVTVAGSASLVGSGTSLSVGGNWNTTGGTFTNGGTTVILNGGGAQAVTQAGSAFAGLTVNKGGGTATLNALQVTGTLTMSAGTANLGTNAVSLDTLLVSGGTLQTSGFSLTVATACTLNGGTFRSSGATTITPALAGGNGGTLDVTGGTISLSGGLSMTGTITHSAGTLSVAAGTVNLANLTGGYAGSGTAVYLCLGSTLVIDSQVTFQSLTIAAATAMTGSTAGLTVNGTLDLDATLTITAGGNASTVATLLATPAAAAALNLGAAAGENLTISGAATIGANATVAAGARTLTFNGTEANVDNDGAITASTGGVVTFTNGYSTTDAGDLTMGGGTLRLGGTVADFTAASCQVTFTAGGTLDFTGGSAQALGVNDETLQALTVNKTTGTVLTVGTNQVLTVTSLSVVTGVLDLNTGTNSATLTVNGTTSVAANGVLRQLTNSNAVTHTFASAVDIAGAFTFTTQNSQPGATLLFGSNPFNSTFGAATNRVNLTGGAVVTITGGGNNPTRRIKLDRASGAGTDQWHLFRNGIALDAATASIAVTNGFVDAATSAGTNSTIGTNCTNWGALAKDCTWQRLDGSGPGVFSSTSVPGDWSDLPVAGDNILFASGSSELRVDVAFTVGTLNMANANRNLVINAPLVASATTVVDADGATGGLTGIVMNANLTTGNLTLTNGAITTNGFTLQVNGNLLVTANTLTVSGGGALNVTGTTEVDGTLLVNGLADLNGNYLAGSTGTVSGTGNLQLAGTTLNFATSTVSLTGGTTTLDGGASQNLVVAGANDTFFNLTVGASGATLTGSTAGLDVDGALTLNSGLTLVGGTADVAGALTINAGTLATNDLSLAVGGLTTVGGTLSVTGTGDTVTLTGGVAGAGTITHSGSTIAVPSATVDLTSLASYTGTTPATFQLTGAAAQTLVVDAGVTFFNLSVGASGATMTGSSAGLNVDGALLCNGGLTLAGGAADVAGALTTTAGLLFLNGQNLTVGGASTLGGNLVTGAATLQLNGTLEFDANLSVGTGGALDANGDVLAGSTGTLFGPGDLNLSGATLNFVTATVSLTGGTTTLDRGAAQTLVVGAPADSFFNLTIGTNGAVMTGSTAGLAVGNDLTCNGNLTLLGGNATVGGALGVAASRTLATNDLGLTVTGLTTITGILTVSGTGDIVALNGGLTGAGTVNQSGDTIQVPTATVDLTTLTAFNGTGGTFQLTGIVAQTLVVDGGVTFFNLTVNAAGATMTGSSVGLNVDGALTLTGGLTLAGGTATVAGATSIAGSLTLNGQNLDAEGLVSGAGTLNATGASNVNVAGGLTVTTYTAGSGTLTFDGAGTWSNGTGSFGAVVVSAAVALGTDVTAGSLSVTAGALSATTFTLTCGGNLTVTGNGFTTTTGGVTFSGAATWTGAAVTSFGDVSINASVTVTTAGATIRTRGLTLGASSSLVATASDLFVAGGLSAGAAGCTFTNAGRTLTFNGGAAQSWNPGASSTINNLATTGAGTAVTINLSPVTVGGTTNVGASSTLTVNASTCVFTGATTVNGTLAHSGNASYLADVDVNNGASFTAGSVTLRFAIGVILRTNAAGATINCTGTSLRLVGTDSPDVPANRWLVFLTAAETFSGVTVQNSDGQAPGAPVAATASSGSDLGNNVDWFGLASVDLRWTGASGGGTNNQWDNAGNWSPALVPFAGCSVVFDGATPGYVVGTGPTVWVGTEVTSFQNFTSIGNSLAGATLFNGTVRLGASASTSFSGTFSHQAGAFDVNNRTLRLNGAATTIDLQLANAAVVQFGGGGAQSLSSTLNPLTFTDLTIGVASAANVTVLTANPIRVNGTFTVDPTATFNTGASDVDLDLNGAATIGGALTADTSSVTCAGAWDSTGAGVVAFSGAGTLTFDGAAAQTVSVGATDVLQSVFASNAAGVTQGATSASWDVNGNLTVSTGSLTLASTGGADVEGVVGVTGGGAAGGLDLNGATVTVGGGVNAGFTTPGGRVIDTAGTGTVTLEPGAAADSLGGAFPITVGNLTIGGPTVGGRSSMQAAAADVTVLVTLTINTGRVLRGGSSTGALRTTAWTLTGTYEDGTQATFVGGNLTVTGTWTDNATGTLTFNRPTAGTQTLAAGGASLGNARVNNGVGGVVATVQLTQVVTFTSLDLNGDDVMNPNGQVLTISGSGTPLTIAAAGNLASGVGAGTVRFTSLAATTLPAATFRDLILDSAVTYTTSSTALTVNGTLTLNVAGATLAANHTLTAGAIAGTGTLAIGAAVPVTLTTGTIATPVIVTGASGTTIAFQTPVTIPNLTYGSLTLNGGAFTVTGSSLSVQGTLTFQGGASVAAATAITFSGAGPSTLQAGTAPQNFAGLTLNKTAAGTTLTLTAVGGAVRQISGPVTITQGTLSVAASWQFNEDTIVGQAGAGTQGTLRMQTTGVNLQLGDGAALPDTVTVHDSMLIGSGSTPSLRLTFGNQARIQVQASGSLSFAGDPGDPNKLQITTTSGVGFIDRVGGGTISAANVAVAFNNATGVVGGITATASEDGTLGSGTGTNTNWIFQGGGALLINSATALGDGAGRINRVRMTFSRQLNTSTLGTNFAAFGLKLGTGTPVTGTAINLVTTTNNDTVDVTFGGGVSTTATDNLSLVYTAPASGRITSFDGISANQNITLDGTTTTPRLFDGAAPTLALVSSQDLDGNGGLDRVVFEFSEPVAFSSRTGVSLSGFDPVTSTASLPTGAELTLRIAGETLTAIPVDGVGPQTTGANIAARIQSAVRDYLLTSAATLNKPAIQNFTCTFTDGRYVLSAGVPVRFVGGTYVSDYTASTVEVVVGGPNDASALLKLGVPNGGTERPGAGNADPGVSVSSGTGTYGPSTATLSIGQDGFTDFTVTASGLVGVANDLQSLVRAKTARSPACQPAYDRFCAVADTGAGRLILVPGTTGAGSGVVVDSLSTFATTAIIGSASIPSGAIERTGAVNATVSIDDLLLRSSTGANLMLGRTPANVTVSGSQVVIDLPNTAGTGTGSPAYLWKDLGDGGFLTDRAHLVIASAGLTNLNTTSNVVIVGDTDGDRQLLVSQGQGVDPGTPTVDASGTVAYLGTSGVTTLYSWAFVSGPATPLSVTTTGPVLQFQARTAGIYRFRLTIQTLDASGQPAQSPLTDNLGRQVVLVDVEIKALSPVASAGPDQVQVATVIQLDGSGSFDPNGGASIAYEWSGFTASGVQLPSSVFSDAAAVQPTFTPTSTGTFTIRLTVRKSPSDLSASDDMLATVIDSANLLPVADAGPDLVGRVNTEITLDGSRSCDPEGAPLTFTWSILSSPQPSTLTGSTTAQPRFVPSVPGSYVLQLVVSDGTVSSLTDSVTVIVIDDATTTPRRAPGAVARAAGLRRAAFLATPPADLRNATIALVLPDGTQRAVTIKDVAGDATDDPTSTATAGLTQVRLVSGLTVLGEVYAPLLTGDDDPVSVVVDSTTQPILSFGVAGEPFTLDGTRSQDDGLIQTFTWTWVSGPSQPFTSRDGSLLAVTPLTGAYVFDLVVTDAIGLSSLPARIVIPVVPASQPEAAPPTPMLTVTSGGTAVASPGTDLEPLVVSVDTNGSGSAPLQTGPATLSPPQVVVLSASTTVYRGGATAGTFTWAQLAGPQAILSGQTTDTLSVTMKIEGAYAFGIQVTDSDGVSNFATAWIVVGADPPIARLTTGRRVMAGTLITLDGSGSTGPTGLSYQWSQLEGAPVVLTAQQSSATTTLDIPGTYRFALRVSSGGVTSAPATVKVRADGTPDQQLASGATTSKSSGGCALAPLDPPDSRSGAALGIVILALLAARRRGRRGE